MEEQEGNAKGTWELQNWMNSSGILRHKEHRSSEEKEHDFGFRYIKSELSLRCAKWDILRLITFSEIVCKFVKYPHVMDIKQ
jgi:hypothetical protein